MTVKNDKKVWSNLSNIDCSDHIEKKGNLSYLSWAWAWQTLMLQYPSATFAFERTEDGSEFWPLPDGTGEVRCILQVEGISRTCWLPVMDYRNQAISNPNARDLNDAKMRCLVKCIALFGLGLYIYAGEDIPQGGQLQSSMVLPPKEKKKEALTPLPKLRKEVKALLDSMEGAHDWAQAKTNKSVDKWGRALLERMLSFSPEEVGYKVAAWKVAQSE